MVASRPRFGSDKSVLKDGPAGKEIDSEAIQDTASEYLQKVQVRGPSLQGQGLHRRSTGWAVPPGNSSSAQKRRLGSATQHLKLCAWQLATATSSLNLVLQTWCS